MASQDGLSSMGLAWCCSPQQVIFNNVVFTAEVIQFTYSGSSFYRKEA